jgi:predicted GH43/DUF377 family glycosyl hydrolase
VGRGRLSRTAFHCYLADIGQDGEKAASVLDRFDEDFSFEDLDVELIRLRHQRDNKFASNRAADRLQDHAERHFSLTFPHDVSLSRRVIVPSSASEAHGVEDARFVEFTEDGDRRYLASYTAFDGHGVTQQLLSTSDFRVFSSTPLVGPGAANKGLAIFPRKVNGRYVALSRCDRESNSISTSDDLSCWNEPKNIPVEVLPWDIVQAGNCGSPIETSEGWLVLTHGVGFVRTYCIGAILLDLDDPTKVVGQLREPLLCAADVDRDGYVPNVVYSCGAMAFSGTLVIPYGIADTSIAFATVSIDALVGSITGS